MKEYIKKLARGEFEYRIPELKKTDPVAAEITENTSVSGTLELFADGRISGTSYTDNPRVKVSGNFSGEEVKIAYSVTAEGMRAGESIKGDFHIVSSAGEQKIPFCFNVVKKEIPREEDEETGDISQSHTSEHTKKEGKTGQALPFIRVWKRLKAELLRGYLDFRMRKVELEDWCRKALLRLNDTNFLSLYQKSEEESYSYLEMQVAKAMILSFSGETDEAHKVLNACGNDLMEDKKKDGILYYTALYITTMINSSDKNLEFAKEKFFEATEFPEVPWQVVLYRFHMDKHSSENASIWLTRFKDAFSNGCTSPVIYLEAIRIFNTQPVLLRVLNTFETQVIRFGYRYGLVEPATTSRITELVSEENKIDMTHLYCLKKLYDEYNSDEILITLCKKMIQGNITGPEFVPIYEQAIKRGLDITRLYEYFLASLDKTKERSLPERVLRYFAYDSTIDHASRAYLYANVLRIKEKDPEIFLLYEDDIVAFTTDRLEGGYIDDNLITLYRWLWDSDTELARRYPSQVFKLQNTWKFTVKSDALVLVNVAQREFNTPKRVPIKNNRSFCFILPENDLDDGSVLITFEDKDGNVYGAGDTEYKAVRALGSRRPVYTSSEECEEDPYFLLYDYRRARQEGDEERAIARAKLLLTFETISEDFARELKAVAYKDAEEALLKGEGPQITPLKGDRKDITDIEDVLARMLFTKADPETTAPVFKELYRLKKQGDLVEAYSAYQSFLYFVREEKADMQVIPIIYDRVLKGGKALPVELASLLKSEATGRREFTEEQKNLYEGIIKAFVSKGYIFSFFKDLAPDLEQPFILKDRSVAECNSEPGRDIYFVFTRGREAGKRVRAKETFCGIYTYDTVLFSDEELVYFPEADGVSYNESVLKSQRAPGDTGTEFRRINDISEMLAKGDAEQAKEILSELSADLSLSESEFEFIM